MSPVEAVIVAGGFGTRMHPLTQHRPKHLLPVAGRPFVVHQLAKLAEAGVSRVVLATSYRAEQFRPLLGDGSRWGLELVYVREEEPLGTGGAIRNAVDHLGSAVDAPVTVLNGDILSSHDLLAQLALHRQRAADVTLHLVEVPDARAFGCVPTDADGAVTDFVEKSPNPVSRQINAGCYVFTRRVIDEIAPGRVVSVERETFPGLLSDRRRVIGYVEGSYWIDVGTPSALLRASADVVRGVATTPAYAEPAGEAWISTEAVVGAGARLRGGTSVGPGAVVGAVVDSVASVICAGADIGRGALLDRCVVGPGARIGAGAVLRGAVVGDDAVVGPGSELPVDTVVACGATWEGSSVVGQPRHPAQQGGELQ